MRKLQHAGDRAQCTCTSCPSFWASLEFMALFVPDYSSVDYQCNCCRAPDHAGGDTSNTAHALQLGTHTGDTPQTGWGNRWPGMPAGTQWPARAADATAAQAARAATNDAAAAAVAAGSAAGAAAGTAAAGAAAANNYAAAAPVPPAYQPTSYNQDYQPVAPAPAPAAPVPVPVPVPMPVPTPAAPASYNQDYEPVAPAPAPAAPQVVPVYVPTPVPAPTAPMVVPIYTQVPVPSPAPPQIAPNVYVPLLPTDSSQVRSQMRGCCGGAAQVCRETGLVPPTFASTD